MGRLKEFKYKSLLGLTSRAETELLFEALCRWIALFKYVWLFAALVKVNVDVNIDSA